MYHQPNFEATWGQMFTVAFWTLVGFYIWDKIDGASRWEAREKAKHAKALAEGWKIWASTKAN
jgi:hypothetical protein